MYCCKFVFIFIESIYTLHVQLFWKSSTSMLYVQEFVFVSSKSILIFSLDMLKVSVCHEDVAIHSNFV